MKDGRNRAADSLDRTARSLSRSSSRCALVAVACVGVLAGPLYAGTAHEKDMCIPGADVIRNWLGADLFERVTYMRNYAPAEDLDALSVWLLAQADDRFGPDSWQAAYALSTRVAALVDSGHGQDPETRRLAEAAVAIGERWLEPGDPAFVSTLGELARAAQESSDWPIAKAAYERVLAVQEERYGAASMHAASVRSNLGIVLAQSGDLESGLAMLKRALADMQAVLPDHFNVRITLKALAWALKLQGDYGEARRFYEQALALSARIEGEKSWGYGATLNDLGNVLIDLGDYAAAESALERALAIIDENLGPDSMKSISMLTNLGAVYMENARYAKAKDSFERGLRIATANGGADGENAVHFQSNLGWALTRTGELDRARSVLTGALATMEAKHSESAEYGLALLRLSELDARSGDHDGALEKAAAAVTKFETYYGRRSPQYESALTQLAELRRLAGDSVGAFEDALSAEAIARDHFRAVAESLAEREALIYATKRAKALDLVLTIAAERGDAESAREAWDAVVQARALVLDELGQRRRSLTAANDPELSSGWATLRDARQRVAELIVAGPSGQPRDAFEASLADALLVRESAERALASRSRSFRNELTRRSLTLRDVSAALPPEGALVAYVEYKKNALPMTRIGDGGRATYLAFVMDRRGAAAQVVPLGDAAQIEDWVFHVRGQIAQEAAAPGRSPKRSESLYREAARELRRKVWDPVASRLGSAKLVYVVPEGDLGLFPFAAFPEDSGGYLVEHAPLIHVLDTERDLAMPPPEQPGRGLLAAGAPAYDGATLLASAPPTGRPLFRGARTACGGFGALRFDPLPSSAMEARAVGEVFRDIAEPDERAILVGEEATETVVKLKVEAKKVVHFATHAFFVGGACGSENPLLLSGLALAGANHRGTTGPELDDGVLTAEEITSLDLGGADWAVLSGCDTGVGQARAFEGMLGLRRAFRVAGARTIISSLWPVEDESARLWMTSLYTHRFKDGLGTAEAVRAASLDVLKERRKKGLGGHPFHWAAFVAVGDWR